MCDHFKGNAAHILLIITFLSFKPPRLASLIGYTQLSCDMSLILFILSLKVILQWCTSILEVSQNRMPFKPLVSSTSALLLPIMRKQTCSAKFYTQYLHQILISIDSIGPKLLNTVCAIAPSKFGFRRNHSTVQQLLVFLESVYK